MRKTLEVETYITHENSISALALPHRETYGEDITVGVNNAAFYEMCRRLRPRVEGGKVEPMHFNMVTLAGFATVFVDKACGYNELSVEEPDA